MAALYDGDSNRMFTANRTEDTHAYQLFKASPKTSIQGKEGSIFWYGFGQNFIQALHVAKEELGRVWKDTWEDLVSAYHRKIAKDRANDEGLVVNSDGLTNMPGDGETTYPSDTAQALIPYKVIEETYDYYEVRNYVNDINQAYTQVLTGYDHNGKIRESYTYGLRDSGTDSALSGSTLPGSDTAGQNIVSQTAVDTGSRILSRLGATPTGGTAFGLSSSLGGRLDYSNGKDTWYYGYTGTGSVSQLTDRKGNLATTYGYDPFGNTTVQDYTGNLTGNKNITENYTLNPYTYNAEYTDASTGNQYLRARYYSPQTGSFFTEDSYLGSLLEPLERNLYTYADNDPVNYRDPSGHGILKKVWNKVKSTATNLYNKAKAGLNNYMNSNTYKSYFNNPSSTSSKGRTGASTGNGYVGKSTGGGSRSGGGGGGSYSSYSYSRSSGGGGSGNTSYRYVKYNPEPTYKVTIGGRTRYYHSEAEANTARKVCDTAERIKKGETVVNPNPVAAAVLASLVAATVVVLTGGTAAPVIGALGLEGFGAGVATSAYFGIIGGATESGLYSALMGNDANQVTEDAIKGGLIGGAIGAVTGGIGYGVKQILNAEPKTVSLFKPGRLGEKTINSFTGGACTKYALKEDTIMYRVYGGKAEKVGSYLSKTQQGGGLQSQLDLALKPEWGNTAEYVTEVIVPKGTIVYEGTAAPQDILDSKGNVIGSLLGGGNQVYIRKVKEVWFQ